MKFASQNKRFANCEVRVINSYPVEPLSIFLGQTLQGTPTVIN